MQLFTMAYSPFQNPVERLENDPVFESTCSLAENRNSVPSTHTGSSELLVTPRDLAFSSGLTGCLHVRGTHTNK